MVEIVRSSPPELTRSQVKVLGSNNQIGLAILHHVHLNSPVYIYSLPFSVHLLRADRMPHLLLDYVFRLHKEGFLTIEADELILSRLSLEILAYSPRKYTKTHDTTYYAHALLIASSY